MTLLNFSNFYTFFATNVCNFSCSYCIAKIPQSNGKRKNVAEENIDALIALFHAVDPGLITISGGEPSLSESVLVIMNELTKHRFTFFTNLSNIPNWYFHESVLFFMATYHHECITHEKFISNIVKLLNCGKKIIVKIILIDEHALDIQLPLFEKLWSLGVPAHFIPVSTCDTFSEHTINRIRHTYLTSCIYTARFYTKINDNPIAPKDCMGGTEKMFEVRRDGSLARCSKQKLSVDSTIFSPVFYNKPNSCTISSCFYCEWHQFSGMSRIDENERWSTFLENGIWEWPEEKEFVKALSELSLHDS